MTGDVILRALSVMKTACKGVQFWIYPLPGDPLTPGYRATKNAKRLDKSMAANLLKIPVLPISYHDAKPLLAALKGAVVPEKLERRTTPHLSCWARVILKCI